MTLQLCGLLLLAILIGIIVWLSNKNGKQAARLKELKRELDGISRAQELANSVSSLSNDDANRLLSQIATKQRASMPNSKF